jgi:hypothetical protein
MGCRNAPLHAVATLATLACVLLSGAARAAGEPLVAHPTGNAGPAAAESLRLEPGQAATAAGGVLTITFVEVVADSRCPRGETCVWEGDAVLRFALQCGDERATVELHTSARYARAGGFAGWRVELVAFEPAPVSGKPAPTAPVATLAVSRGDAPGASLQ